MKTYQLMIEVEMADNEDSGTVKIGALGPMSPAAAMLAVEHMMNMFAGESAAGYERALELLCEGARKAKRRLT